MLKQELKLVDMAIEHLELVFNWRNEPYIRNVMFNSEPLIWGNHVKWFESLVQHENLILKILYYKGIPYGVANVSIKKLNDGIGEWGFYIGEKAAPKGMGKALAYMILNFIFEEIKLRKICAEVLDYNEISLKFHEKVGFKKEGILRKHVYKENRFCDIHLFSIFKDEWEVTRKVIEKELFD